MMMRRRRSRIGKRTTPPSSAATPCCSNLIRRRPSARCPRRHCSTIGCHVFAPAPPKPYTRRSSPPRAPPAPTPAQAITTSSADVLVLQAESWWRALARKDDRLRRDAWLAHQGLLARQATQRFSDAVAGPAVYVSPAQPAASPPGSEIQRVCVDAGFTCPACRFRPAKVVTAPRTHLCLCWDCGYVFRDDPAIACPVCAAVRAWGIAA